MQNIGSEEPTSNFGVCKGPCGEQEGMGVKLSGLPLSSQSHSPCKPPLREKRSYILPKPLLAKGGAYVVTRYRSLR